LLIYSGGFVPVWSRAISAKGTVKATPGDLIVADDDGVVVVPRHAVPETAGKAQTRAQEEEGKRRRLAAGELGLDMYKMREALEKAGLRYIDEAPGD
jgi:4-hydroxy-4-methyl-2-oxoglutarate aldolase